MPAGSKRTRQRSGRSAYVRAVKSVAPPHRRRLIVLAGRLVLAGGGGTRLGCGGRGDRSGLDHHRSGSRGEPRRADGLPPRLFRRAGRARGPIVAAAGAAPCLAILTFRRLRRRLRAGGGRYGGRGGGKRW